MDGSDSHRGIFCFAFYLFLVSAAFARIEAYA